MGAVFISYRRGDSSGAAGRLFDRLEQALGRSRIFMDVDSIEPGLDFVDVLNRHLAQCDVMLAVIGPKWLSSADGQGRRRIEDDADFVRMEIESALSRGVRVIPVLVDGCAPIAAIDLPEALKALARRQAIEIRHDRFGVDADQLAETLRKIINTQPESVESESVLISAAQLAELENTIAESPNIAGLYRERHLSPAQIANIRRAAQIPAKARLLALLDLRERSGKDGISITDQGIFACERDGRPSYISFRELAASPVRRAGVSGIAIGSTQLDATGTDLNGVVGFLNRLSATASRWVRQ